MIKLELYNTEKKLLVDKIVDSVIPIAGDRLTIDGKRYYVLGREIEYTTFYGDNLILVKLKVS